MSIAQESVNDRERVAEKLIGRLSDVLDIDSEEISENALLIEDLDVDSLDLLELVLAMKDDFAITVHDGEVKALLSDLARFLPEPERIVSDSPLSDAELSEVSRRLRVGTIVDFVVDRMGT